VLFGKSAFKKIPNPNSQILTPKLKIQFPVYRATFPEINSTLSILLILSLSLKKISLPYMEKDLGYYIGYWITALLPVIIGFTVTILLVRYFEKTYKGPDDEENQTD